jgi:hypothetical protein
LRREPDGFQKKFRFARQSALFLFGKQIMPERHITKEANIIYLDFDPKVLETAKRTKLRLCYLFSAI